MPASLLDRPGLDPATFFANIIEIPGQPHNLTVTGRATGDYRVKSVKLARAHHQPDTGRLVLDVDASSGPWKTPIPSSSGSLNLNTKRTLPDIATTQSKS